MPGIRRHRRGRGFSYHDASGRAVADAGTLDRIRGLAIPPAWTDVWICPDPSGHLQAAGTDAAGRRQYIYHEAWRRRRDVQKFDRILGFAQELPAIRERVASDINLRGMPAERALACAVRLLDRAFFRVGSEAYARQNGSFGVATLRKEHVRVRGDTLMFDFRAKSGQRRVQHVRDPEVARVVRVLKRRNGGGRDLLAYKEQGTWRDVRSTDVNAYIKDLAGDGFSAKDFRTWHGTVTAAVCLALAEEEMTENTSRRKVVAAAIKQVAEYLGNTPAVARSSYVDPRVVDRFLEGRTIAAALEEDPGSDAWQDAVERATLELLSTAPNRERRERKAA